MLMNKFEFEMEQLLQYKFFHLKTSDKQTIIKYGKRLGSRTQPSVARQSKTAGQPDGKAPTGAVHNSSIAYLIQTWLAATQKLHLRLYTVILTFSHSLRLSTPL